MEAIKIPDGYGNFITVPRTPAISHLQALADKRLVLLIETERRVREHEFAHRRICPYCGCQIGLCYLAIGVDPITKQHDPDCELAKELADA